MQLKEYIALVVEDIFEGIKTLQKTYNPQYEINTPVVSPSLTSSEQKVCFVNDVAYCINTINFDVVLLAEETISKGKKGGISLKIANANADQNSVSSSMVSQRVTFPIHVVYPSITTTNEPEKHTLRTELIMN